MPKRVRKKPRRLKPPELSRSCLTVRSGPLRLTISWGLRRLVINADDFGLTAGVNHAIAEAHSRGVVTSATLMARSSEFSEAVRIGANNPSLGVGCHVMLLDGNPILPPHLVPSLLRDGTAFRQTLAQLAFAVAYNRISAAEVEAEATAQLAQLISAGVRISHVDTHKHAHMFPSILKPLLRAARACGIRAVRNPFSPANCPTWNHVARHPELWKRFVAVQLLRGFAPDFRRIIERDGMITTNGTLGVVETGSLTIDLLRAIISYMPEGTWELVCHPGYDDAQLARVQTRLRQSRSHELQIFTSPELPALLAQHGVELITYWDLHHEQPSRAADTNRTAV
jgi:chitin disaccharide deacetylase